MKRYRTCELCKHAFTLYSTKTLCIINPTPCSREAFTNREEPLSLRYLYLEFKKHESAKVHQMCPKILKSPHNSGWRKKHKVTVLVDQSPPHCSGRLQQQFAQYFKTWLESVLRCSRALRKSAVGNHSGCADCCDDTVRRKGSIPSAGHTCDYRGGRRCRKMYTVKRHRKLKARAPGETELFTCILILCRRRIRHFLALLNQLIVQSVLQQWEWHSLSHFIWIHTLLVVSEASKY